MSLADGIAWEKENGLTKAQQSKIISGQGEMKETEFGAMRESNEGRGRFDLLPYEAIEALAMWYEAGSKKYEERNWEKGISVKDCINRMIRHSLKAGNGRTDEDHLAAVMWNAAAAITMMQRMPECNDHVWHYEEEKPGFLTKKFNILEEKKVALDCYTCMHGVKKDRCTNSDDCTFSVDSVPTGYSPIIKAAESDPTCTILPDNDIAFLIMSLQSGGINDIETLIGWLNRRRV